MCRTLPSLVLSMLNWRHVKGAVCLRLQDVEHVDLSQRPFLVRGSETEVRTHSIIIATGANAKRLGIPSEEQFWSNGISACAICDGARLQCDVPYNAGYTPRRCLLWPRTAHDPARGDVKHLPQPALFHQGMSHELQGQALHLSRRSSQWWAGAIQHWRKLCT